MAPTLGEKLRTAREERGISISEVAEQTRISPLYLEAIDADNYKTLPGGIFNKGFVRSYAKYVGIDEQEALQDYSRLIAQTQPAVEEEFKTYRPEVLTDDRAASSIVPTVIFAAVILGLMTAGILFLVNYIQNQQSEPQIAANTINTNLSATPAGETNTNPAAVDAVPAMSSLRVEFTANGDEVWLSSVMDGKAGQALVTSGKSVTFEPKESLDLRYSRSRAQFAQLKVNGKDIRLPQQPENASQSSIELKINESNLAQIWESGQIQFGGNVSGTVPPAQAPGGRPAARTPAATTQPSGTGANTNSGTPPAAPAAGERPVMRPAATPAAERPAANSDESN